MNKVYRTVFNETTNTWVAVAEISPAKGKKSRSEKSSGGIGLHLMDYEIGRASCRERV